MNGKGFLVFLRNFFIIYWVDFATVSSEAQLVFDAGRELWKAYFSTTDIYQVRNDLKLNRADVGWYQVRKALEARNSSGDFAPVSFDEFKKCYEKLSDKLRPQVFELGFLRE